MRTILIEEEQAAQQLQQKSPGRKVVELTKADLVDVYKEEYAGADTLNKKIDVALLFYRNIGSDLQNEPKSWHDILKVVLRTNELTPELIQETIDLREIDPDYLPNTLPEFLDPPKKGQTPEEFKRIRDQQIREARKKGLLLDIVPGQVGEFNYKLAKSLLTPGLQLIEPFTLRLRLSINAAKKIISFCEKTLLNIVNQKNGAESNSSTADQLNRRAYLTSEQERDRYRVFPWNGRLNKLPNEIGDPLVYTTINESAKGQKGRAAHVISPEGNFYVFSHISHELDSLEARELYFHSSILSGHPVLTAGIITTDAEGNIIKLENSSGHYQPDIENFYRSLIAMSKDLDLSNTQIKYFNGCEDAEILRVIKEDDTSFIRLAEAGLWGLVFDCFDKGASINPSNLADFYYALEKFEANQPAVFQEYLENEKIVINYHTGIGTQHLKIESIETFIDLLTTLAIVTGDIKLLEHSENDKGLDRYDSDELIEVLNAFELTKALSQPNKSNKLPADVFKKAGEVELSEFINKIIATDTFNKQNPIHQDSSHSSFSGRKKTPKSLSARVRSLQGPFRRRNGSWRLPQSQAPDSEEKKDKSDTEVMLEAIKQEAKNTRLGIPNTINTIEALENHCHKELDRKRTHCCQLFSSHSKKDIFYLAFSEARIAYRAKNTLEALMQEIFSAKGAFNDDESSQQAPKNQYEVKYLGGEKRTYQGTTLTLPRHLTQIFDLISKAGDYQITWQSALWQIETILANNVTEDPRQPKGPFRSRITQATYNECFRIIQERFHFKNYQCALEMAKDKTTTATDPFNDLFSTVIGAIKVPEQGVQLSSNQEALWHLGQMYEDYQAPESGQDSHSDFIRYMALQDIALRVSKLKNQLPKSKRTRSNPLYLKFEKLINGIRCGSIKTIEGIQQPELTLDSKSTENLTTTKALDYLLNPEKFYEARQTIFSRMQKVELFELLDDKHPLLQDYLSTLKT